MNNRYIGHILYINNEDIRYNKIFLCCLTIEASRDCHWHTDIKILRHIDDSLELEQIFLNELFLEIYNIKISRTKVIALRSLTL